MGGSVRYVGMDQRREPRFQSDQPVVVQILTDPPTRMEARVKNASGRGLGLVTPAPIPAGSAVRLEMEDTVVLGEAIYCRDDQGLHYVGVELDQVLVGLTELGKRLAALMQPGTERELTRF
jgi:PilZ domain